MFRDGLRIRGTTAAVVWGYHTAATCEAWSITRAEGAKWELTATVARRDPFMLSRRPLFFTAPHHKGRWCWPVESINVGTNQIRAILGHPEQ